MAGVMARFDIADDECLGSVNWRKEASPDDASFPEGWNTLYAQARGRRYRAPLRGSGCWEHQCAHRMACSFSAVATYPALPPCL